MTDTQPTSTASFETSDRLLSLMSQWYEDWGAGHDLTPQELCPDSPQLQAELQLRIEALKRLQGRASTISEDTPDESDQPLPRQLGDRYRVFYEIARGGMGAVYAAHDVAIGRAVAVKVMRGDHRQRDSVRKRFIDETHITGQLQHPCVPPVHDHGTLPDGRPYLVMKLIKGRTFAELLKERPDPRHDLPQVLEIFEKVAQTVAFAHTKSVIHRDLKPANVMVGAFGEVQVMDWGLAKVLPNGVVPPNRSADDPMASVIESERDSNSNTRTGSVLGTPAYMPPEQAHGDVAHIGRPADVFALGAILCEILTGQPPYTGTGTEIRIKATLGELDDAHLRLDDCDADEDLVQLARHCLAADPEERPADGGVVATALTQIRLTAEQSRLHWEATQKIAEKRKRRALEAETLMTMTFICHLEECGVESELVALGRRCLSLDPKVRFKSVKELTAALAQYCTARGHRPKQ